MGQTCVTSEIRESSQNSKIIAKENNFYTWPAMKLSNA